MSLLLFFYALEIRSNCVICWLFYDNQRKSEKILFHAGNIWSKYKLLLQKILKAAIFVLVYFGWCLKISGDIVEHSITSDSSFNFLKVFLFI